MKARWLILSLAGLLVVATWGAAAVAYFFKPSLALWTALVTAAALSLEALFWVGAGVLGWSIFAGRRQVLARLRKRFFGS